MRFISVRSLLLGVIMSLAMVLISLGTSFAGPAQGGIEILHFDDDQVERRQDDGSRLTIHIQGHMKGQRDGTANGSIQMDDGSQVVRFDVTGWGVLTLDENGDLERASFPAERTIIQPDGREATGGAVTISLTVTDAGIDLKLGEYGTATVPLKCEVWQDDDGYPWQICWDEEDTLAAS